MKSRKKNRDFSAAIDLPDDHGIQFLFEKEMEKVLGRMGRKMGATGFEAETFEAELQIIGGNIKRSTVSCLVKYTPGTLTPSRKAIRSCLYTIFADKVGLGEIHLRKEGFYSRTRLITSLGGEAVDWALKRSYAAMPFEEKRDANDFLVCVKTRTSLIKALLDEAAELIRVNLISCQYYHAADASGFKLNPGSSPIIMEPDEAALGIAPVEEVVQTSVPDSTLAYELVDAKAELSREKERSEDLQEELEMLHDRIHALKAKLEDQAVMIDRHRQEVAAARDDGSLEAVDPVVIEPVIESWDDLFAYIRDRYSDSIEILPQAEKSAGSSEFEDLQEVKSALDFLAGPYATIRAGRGDDAMRADLREGLKLAGFRISRVGTATVSKRFKDSYMAKYQGELIKLDEHLAGCSSRDPARCLRIYFHWRDEKVIVGHLPSHLASQETTKL